VTIDSAKNVCPSERPPELAPEMVVLFDASGSMDLNIAATPEDEKWLGQLKQRASRPGYRPTPSEIARYEQLTAEPTRISIARQATIGVVQRLPRDVLSRSNKHGALWSQSAWPNDKSTVATQA
jgi:hypothetical protein